jgi:hypothetical protein
VACYSGTQCHRSGFVVAAVTYDVGVAIFRTAGPPQQKPGRSSETIVGAAAGLVAGYVLWLAAISIGESLTTVSKWSLAVLLLSVALAVGAVAGGTLMRWRRRYFLAAFAFGLPVLPVVLALAVLANVYL